MVILQNGEFDAVAFWRAQVWGEGSLRSSKERLFFPGRCRRLHFLSKKGHGEAFCCFPQRERSYHYTSIRWGFRRGRVAGKRGWPAWRRPPRITSCIALKIDRTEMVRVMHEEHGFSDLS